MPSRPFCYHSNCAPNLRSRPPSSDVGFAQLRAQPAERVGGQFGGKDPPARVPAGEPGVVVGAVEAARAARHRFQQVGPPDRLADLDGLRGVDGSLQLTAAEHPQLEPHAVLGPLVALARIGVDEVKVPDDHADPLESEGIEHREPLPDRGHSPACPSLSHGPPSPVRPPGGHVPGTSRFRSGGITPEMVRW